MNEYDDLVKDVEITISFNEFMKILKAYDEIRVRRDIPCQIDDKFYYPSITLAFFSMVQCIFAVLQNKCFWITAQCIGVKLKKRF